MSDPSCPCPVCTAKRAASISAGSSDVVMKVGSLVLGDFDRLQFMYVMDPKFKRSVCVVEAMYVKQIQPASGLEPGSYVTDLGFLLDAINLSPIFDDMHEAMTLSLGGGL